MQVVMTVSTCMNEQLCDVHSAVNIKHNQCDRMTQPEKRTNPMKQENKMVM